MNLTRVFGFTSDHELSKRDLRLITHDSPQDTAFYPLSVLILERPLFLLLLLVCLTIHDIREYSESHVIK
jgi:hypothetical protein